MILRTALLAALVAMGLAGAASACGAAKSGQQAQTLIPLPNQDGSSS
jgi:hypothetical protein